MHTTGQQSCFNRCLIDQNKAAALDSVSARLMPSRNLPPAPSKSWSGRPCGCTRFRARARACARACSMARLT
eukprot:2837973-Pleurochrysis_carterae.AAC.2